MTNHEEHWITTREAAARLDVPPRELYQLIDEGQLPAFKDGRDLRLRTEDVDDYRSTRPSA